MNFVTGDFSQTAIGNNKVEHIASWFENLMADQDNEAAKNTSFHNSISISISLTLETTYSIEITRFDLGKTNIWLLDLFQSSQVIKIISDGGNGTGSTKKTGFLLGGSGSRECVYFICLLAQ